MLETTSLEMPKSLSTVQKTTRKVAFKCLAQLSVGSLTVIESFFDTQQTRTERFGKVVDGQPNAIIEIHHADFYRRLLQGGSIAAGEAYMDGWWESPDLTQLMHLMALNMNALDGIEAKSNVFSLLATKFTHWLKRNTLKQSKENIGEHYDLGNDLYHTFLDSKMLYSSALFLSEQDSLEQAQINKMDRLCQQLQLTASDHVMEIGTGWGGMAIYMAQHYGCKVTTTTISEEQYAYAQQCIQQAGLDHQITLLKQDYRLLEGQFDKLVSIEMIEAVGKSFLPSYVKKCSQLLKPGGLMAIQAITIADQRYASYSNNVDFIQKYIFPGGFLPSITALTCTTTQHSDLILRDLKDIGLDYAQTLQHWHQRFNQQLEQVQQLGYDERFIRMWRYYFCYCEGGFLAKSISTVHMTFSKP